MATFESRSRRDTIRTNSRSICGWLATSASNAGRSSVERFAVGGGDDIRGREVTAQERHLPEAGAGGHRADGDDGRTGVHADFRFAARQDVEMAARFRVPDDELAAGVGGRLHRGGRGVQDGFGQRGPGPECPQAGRTLGDGRIGCKAQGLALPHTESRTEFRTDSTWLCYRIGPPWCGF